MNKRMLGGLTLVAGLVLGGALGFTLHAPGRPRTWDDIRTWLTFAAIVIGVPVAIYQLYLQRRQLAEQHDVIKDEITRNVRRDQLLDGQLRELEERVLTAERAQAEQIELSWRPAQPIEGVDAQDTRHVWMAVVDNQSRRPIRDVACRVEPLPEQDYNWEASAVAQLVPGGMPPSTEFFFGPEACGTVRLIRGGRKYGFKFPFPTEGHEHAEFKVRFGDDAGLRWEIDHDLHLTKLTARDW